MGASRRRGASRFWSALPLAARATRWQPLAAGSVIAVSIVLWRHGHDAAVPMQAVALVLAAGAGFALDDPAAETLAASPTSLARRRGWRLLIVLPAMASLYGLLLRLQGTQGRPETTALSLLSAGLVGLSLAAAATAGRTSRWRNRGGDMVAPMLLLLVLLSSAIPERWRPLPFGDVPGGWAQIYTRWTAAAVIGFAILTLLSRDPAARRLRHS